MKLEQIQVIFRHGARTPLSYWSRKKFQNFSNFKPEIWNKDELLKMIPATNIKYTLQLADGSEPFGYPIDRYDESADHLLVSIVAYLANCQIISLYLSYSTYS